MSERVCSICQDVPDCVVMGYDEVPFVDGKKYDTICHRCFCTINKWEFDAGTDRVITYRHQSPYHINDVDRMMAYGWSREESLHSINAVKRKVSNMLSIKPNGSVHFLESLFLGREVELVNWPDENYEIRVC